MKKIKNDSQPYGIYIFAIICLPFAASFVGLCFYAILSSFDKINFGSMYGILLSIIFLYLINLIFFLITKPIISQKLFLKYKFNV